MSSNLIARSCFYRQAPKSLLVLFMATWPSGKAEVCKTFITGSNPVVAFITSIEKALVSGLFLRLGAAITGGKRPPLKSPQTRKDRLNRSGSAPDRYHAAFPSRKQVSG